MARKLGCPASNLLETSADILSFLVMLISALLLFNFSSTCLAYYSKSKCCESGGGDRS